MPTCEAEVTPKYHNTNPECCCSMLLGKSKSCKVCNKKTTADNGTIEVVTMPEARKLLSIACVHTCTPAACGMASSECVTPCGTESYRCLDQNKNHLLQENVQACEAEVAPKFSTTTQIVVAWSLSRKVNRVITRSAMQRRSDLWPWIVSSRQLTC